MPDAHRLALRLEPVKLIRMVESHDRRVFLRRLEVLAEG
jgi:hypothetical protein